MFNQRHWDELHAFTASFDSSNVNGSNGQSQPQFQQVTLQHHQPEHQFQQPGDQQFHQQQQQQHQQPHYFQQPQQQQPPTPAPQQHFHHQQQSQTQSQQQSLQYDYPSQQEWSNFGFNPSATSAAPAQPAQQHGSSFGNDADGGMDWTPTSDFSDSLPQGMVGSFQIETRPAPQPIKIETDVNHAHQPQSGGQSGGSGAVGPLIDYFDDSNNQPALPPRRTETSMTGNSVTSPIAINQQQSTAQFSGFNAAPQSNSFASNSFASQSFASHGMTASSDSNFGSFTSQRRVASPVATSPPAASFGSFHDGARVITPSAGPSSNPFGSMDGFMANHSVGHNISTSPMVSSPGPITPGHAHGGSSTPGFAMWRAPSQHQEQHQFRRPSQPQPQPQPVPQHHQSYPQFPQQQFPPQYQQHQPHPQHQQSLQSPAAVYPNHATSPGGYFRPPVPPTPKPAAGNQFILELNPGAKAKPKAPPKPPKVKPSKPSLPTIDPSPSTPFSPGIKPEPSTPNPDALSLSAAQNDLGEDSASHAAMLNRPSREQVPAEAWEGYKSTIRDLYLEQRKPLKEVMNIMAEKYNFQATPKMYKTRFSQWGFVKNNTEDEVKRLLSMKFQRDAEGKVSEFVRNGKIVNLSTYLKRKGVTEYDLVDFELPSNLPSHIRCRTPTPPPAPEYLKSPDLMRAQELVVGNMRKAFLQCRQWELETERQVGWPSVMVWGAPSSEMLAEANFYFEAKDADSGGQCLMNAFNQLEIDLKQLSPQAIFEVLLGMVRRDLGLMTALCKYVAAFSTTNYDRSHPLRQIFTCLYDVQQKHGAATLSELLWGSTPLVAEELEAIYGRRHPYVARSWCDLAIFYEQKSTERLEKLALELRLQHRQMEQTQGTDINDLLALRYTIAQLFYGADPESESAKQAANDLLKDMQKAKLLHRVRDSRPNTFCYHCAVKNDPWTKRCRRRYDSIVELLEKHTDVKIQPYFEEDFHTTHHEMEPEDSWTAALGQQQSRQNSRWGFI